MKDSTKKVTRQRRKLLKALASGGGVVLAAGGLPRHWNKPVVDAVMLPAHAQTTAGAGFFGSQFVDSQIASLPDGDSSRWARALDAIVPSAFAGNAGSSGPGALIELAVTILDEIGYSFVLKRTETFECFNGGLLEYSSLHTGTGSDGQGKSASGTGCDSTSIPANLTVEFLTDALRAFGDVDGINFDFQLNPGGTAPTATPCVNCPILEETN